MIQMLKYCTYFCLLEPSWKHLKFEHELTASFVHPLRNVGPCVLVEAAMQDDVITNWPRPVVSAKARIS